MGGRCPKKKKQRERRKEKKLETSIGENSLVRRSGLMSPHQNPRDDLNGEGTSSFTEFQKKTDLRGKRKRGGVERH